MIAVVLLSSAAVGFMFHGVVLGSFVSTMAGAGFTIVVLFMTANDSARYREKD